MRPEVLAAAIVLMAALSPAAAFERLAGPFTAETLSIEGWRGAIAVETGAPLTIELHSRDPAALSAARIEDEGDALRLIGSPSAQFAVLERSARAGGPLAGEVATIDARIVAPADVAIALSGLVGDARLGARRAGLSLDLASASRVELDAAGDLEIDAAGNAEIVVRRLDGDLTLRAEDASSVRIEGGEAGRLAVSIRGKARFVHAGAARSAAVDIEGFGSARLGEIERRPLASIEGGGAFEAANW